MGDIYSFIFNKFICEKLIFEIIGEGSELEKIKEYIKKKNLNNIHILGKISNDKVLDLYSKSKIIIAPSIWPEPFGRFILESMATGTPLVTTNTGGTPEGIKNRETGMIVEPNHPEQISKAIKELLNNKNLYNKIVKNLRKEAKKYSSEVIGKKRIKLYGPTLKII